MDTKKITLPEGWEVEKVEGSVIYLKETRKELPKTWKEFCELYPVKDGEAYIDADSGICVEEIKDGESMVRHASYCRNFMQNKSQARAFLALMQLIQLRDCYRQGWSPLTANDYMHSVSYDIEEKEIVADTYIDYNKVLSFPTEEIRDQFMENFRDLIEEAKELI